MKETDFTESGTENSVETEYAKCTSCGANMEFDPESKALLCPHCGNRIFFESKTADEIDLLSGFSQDNAWDKQFNAFFKCDNCGANVVLGKNETASCCPFCGTPQVKKQEELCGIKPSAVLPFEIAEEKAVLAAKKWFKSRFYATKDFKKNLNGEHLKGVYVPCFTFDSYTTSSYVGRIGITRTRTVGSGKNARTETYTVWRNIAGTYYFNFDDVLISAGNQLDHKIIDKISPFNTNEGKEYDNKYLLGYMAYHYDKEISECWEDAKNIMDSKLKSAILGQYPHDKMAYFNVSTSHERVTYKYVMLPVYVGCIKHSKKNYNFYINGSTSKTWGEYPKSFWKIFFTVMFGILVFLGTIILLSEFGSCG